MTDNLQNSTTNKPGPLTATQFVKEANLANKLNEEANSNFMKANKVENQITKEFNGADNLVTPLSKINNQNNEYGNQISKFTKEIDESQKISAELESRGYSGKLTNLTAKDLAGLRNQQSYDSSVEHGIKPETGYNPAGYVKSTTEERAQAGANRYHISRNIASAMSADNGGTTFPSHSSYTTPGSRLATKGSNDYGPSGGGSTNTSSVDPAKSVFGNGRRIGIPKNMSGSSKTYKYLPKTINLGD